MKRSELRQLVREAVTLALTEQPPAGGEGGAGEEAKKRGLKSIGFGRYVDPANPGTVVAKVQNGQLVAVKGEPGADAPTVQPPERAAPKHQAPTQAGGEPPAPEQRGREPEENPLTAAVKKVVEPEKIKMAALTGDVGTVKKSIDRLAVLRNKLEQRGAEGTQLDQIDKVAAALQKKFGDATRQAQGIAAMGG